MQILTATFADRQTKIIMLKYFYCKFVYVQKRITKELQKFRFVRNIPL